MRPGTTKKTSNQSPGNKKPTPEQNDPRNPAKKIIGNIDLFMFSIPLHIYQVM
jgi:hypothetical protein